MFQTPCFEKSIYPLGSCRVSMKVGGFCRCCSLEGRPLLSWPYGDGRCRVLSNCHDRLVSIAQETEFNNNNKYSFIHLLKHRHSEVIHNVVIYAKRIKDCSMSVEEKALIPIYTKIEKPFLNFRGIDEFIKFWNSDILVKFVEILSKIDNDSIDSVMDSVRRVN